MKKYIVFEHRAECKHGASVSEMEAALMEGDPVEVARFDSWDAAKEYLQEHPGAYWTCKTFTGSVGVVHGCFTSECELDEDGEILIQGDTEFCELRKYPDVPSCYC